MPRPYRPFFTLQTFVKTTLIASCVFATQGVLAEDVMQVKPLPYTPGITIEGLFGNNSSSIGYADMMAPLVGNRQSFLHVNPQVLFHDSDSYTLSLGGGGRYWTEHAGILGAYVFGDYNHSPHGNSFWFVSPGVERLGSIIDMSANLYIPVSDTHKDFSVALGETLGTSTYISFAGHNQYDAVLHSFESTGVGADAEIGVRIPMTHNPKVYVGGYYFNPKDATDKVQGVTARLEAPVTDRLTLVLSDSYDKTEHNTAKIGLQYAFGARKNSLDFSGDLAERMVDPIQRDLVAVSGPSNTGQPIAQTYNKPEETVLTKSHIAFFNALSAPGGDGTYERPFQQMTQGNVDAANGGGNTNLYVNTGLYNIGNNNVLFTNDNLYGRQSDNGHPFVQAAVGDNRPLFQFDPSSSAAGFTLAGTHNLFDSVRLVGGAAGSAGLGTGILLANDAVQQTSFSIHNSDVNYFLNGLASTGPLNKEVNLSLTNAHFDGNRGRGVNLSAIGDISITAENVTFNGNSGNGFVMMSTAGSVTARMQNARFDGNAGRGFSMTAANNININLSNITVNRNGTSSTSSGFVMTAGNNINMHITDAAFNGNAVDGLFVRAMNDLNMHISNTTFNNNRGLAGGSGLVMMVGNNANVEVNNAAFNGNGVDGLFASVTNNLTLTVQNASFNGNGNRGLFARADNSATVHVDNAIFDGNVNGLFLQHGNSANPFTAVIQNSSITNNSNFGVQGVNLGTNGSMTIDLTGSVLAGNTTPTSQTLGDKINWLP